MRGRIRHSGRSYLRLVGKLVRFNFPLYAVGIALAEPLVRFLVSADYLDFVPVLRWLCAYFLLRSLYNPVGNLVVATARTRREFWWNVGTVGILALGIYLAGLRGVEWVAAAQFGLFLVLHTAFWWWLIRPLAAVDFVAYSRAVFSGLPFGLAVGGLCWASYTLLPAVGALPDLVILALGGSLAAGGILLKTKTVTTRK